MKTGIVYFSLIVFALLTGCSKEVQKQKPNVLFIYADDLGYGDPGCYNPGSKIPTPNIDKLAAEGLVFTDAHAPASICGPSRYGVLTGRYSWRRPGGYVNGKAYDECKIGKGRKTIADMFREEGYNTAQIGKWGLRNNYKQALRDPDSIADLDSITPRDFDFSKPIDAPNTRGFDYSLTMVMFAEMRNGRMQKNDKWLMENGYPYPKGATPDPANFDWENCLPELAKKATEYINTYAGKQNRKEFNIDRDKPFFLYFDPHVPHEPIVPTKEFIGSSEAGKYGDFVVELDHYIGELIKVLKENGLYENTIVIFASDNGAEGTAYNRILKYRHYSNGDLRGAKRDVWEGGHRVPFIIKWPGKTKAGAKCNTPVCFTDLFATFADYFGYTLDNKTAPDSYSFLDLISDPEAVFNRPPIIHNTHRRVMAIRDGDWLYIDAPTGTDNPEPEWFRKERGVVPSDMPVELFNLKDDLQQTRNVAGQYPNKATELKDELFMIMGEDK
ncbi:MAG: arylsulfatase [Chlorobi bacterium]|nr:arylsulfatase [Chlorobiota bacterium]